MTYANITPAIFRRRPNRFIAEALIGGQAATAHVKNTGRCAELLIPGSTVYLNRVDNPLQSTKYDLVAVRKGERLINMDSYAPNRAFGEYLRSGAYISNATLVKPEAKYVKSRFDFYVEAHERRIFIEVKGVTLEDNGAVMFPDAPTERGVKHLQELATSIDNGYEAHVVFVIQMSDVLYFTPNDKMHSAFGDALRAAQAAGVIITTPDCAVTENSMTIWKNVPIKLFHLKPGELFDRAKAEKWDAPNKLIVEPGQEITL